jgi:hypothetical protein
MKWDVFVSHASEDKDVFVRPLVEELVKRNVKVWYDDDILEMGDNLRRSIDEGLNESRYAIVIFSPYFFTKQWTQWELDGLVSKEVGGKKVILPIWHGVTKTDVLKYSPSLVNKLAIDSSKGINYVVEKILQVIRPVIVEMQEFRGSKLEDIFKVSKEWRNKIDPYGIEALLRDYASRYTKIIAFEMKHRPTKHEWGYGGTRESLYSLLNDKKEALFEVSEQDTWETYSDDSEDYALPTTITIRAIPFMFENLIQECLALLKKV